MFPLFYFFSNSKNQKNEMKMKKIYLIIFLLIGTGICIYGIQEKDSGEYEEYSTPDFSLYYPKNWDVLESNDSIIFANPDATYVSLNIQVVASRENGGTYDSIGDAGDDIKRKLNEETKSYKKISEKLTKLDGKEAIEIECEFDYGINFSQIQIITKNENFYVLTYTSLKENYGENLRHYVKARESLRIK